MNRKTLVKKIQILKSYINKRINRIHSYKDGNRFSHY